MSEPWQLRCPFRPLGLPSSQVLSLPSILPYLPAAACPCGLLQDRLPGPRVYTGSEVNAGRGWGQRRLSEWGVDLEESSFGGGATCGWSKQLP